MHLKIQGGGDGKYSNQGSCSSLVSYLEHEDLERIKQGLKAEPFFNHSGEVSGNTIISEIDNNKKKLCKNDSKFFMITFSPSKEEQKHLGLKEENKSEKIKDYVRKELMQQYAENFNKGLNAEDLMYFAKIHHERIKSANDENLHVHILVSRKTLDGRLKISPQTNHRNTKSGAVKGGFVRIDFYKNAEMAFDRKFLYLRKKEEHFDYKKQYKIAKPDELKLLIESKLLYNQKQSEQHLSFFNLLKEQDFDSDLIDHMLKGGRVQKDQSIYSIALTNEGQFQLQSIKRTLDSLKQNLEITNEEESLRSNRRKRGRSW
ncbi:DUF5712 family protein [Gelidibacter mesophilus]|uniref:DUF5712 family protein n=1 Tax=Gelidibacter mesophilus TaxID=169050 RepID=UPI000414014B|nr:DUF5712 family protein [Gelidibacter mesophilus]